LFHWSPRRQALFWGIFGIAMLPFTLWNGWFLLEIGDFFFPIVVLPLLYAALQLLLHVLSKRQIIITEEELARFGKALEKGTPMMLDMLEQGRSVKLVADAVQEKYDVPASLTHRYLIVLLQTIQHDGKEILVPKDDERE